MRITRKHVSITWTVTILTLLLITTPPTNSAYSSSQQGATISNYGTMRARANGEFDILFEYGAESGVLQPPWDGLDEYKGTISVSSTYARTGTKSVYIYQNPDGTDSGRRCHMREHGSSLEQHEMYISWWIYITNSLAAPQVSGQWGPTLGGFQSFFYPVSGSQNGHWQTAGRFGMGPEGSSNPYIHFSWGCGKDEKAPDFSQTVEDIEDASFPWSTWGGAEFYVADHIGEWVHLQIYVKIATGTSGVVRAWVNDAMNELTGISTDMRGYSEWNSNPIDGGKCKFKSKNADGYPSIGVDLYQGENAKECYYYMDDFVVATGKVSETYRVLGK